MYETTKSGGSQYGAVRWHVGVPLHVALAPSAQRPSVGMIGQSQVPCSASTAWQSVRVSLARQPHTFAKAAFGKATFATATASPSSFDLVR